MIEERSLLEYAMIMIDSFNNELIGEIQYELMITGMMAKVDEAIKNNVIDKQVRDDLLRVFITCDRKKVKELL